MTPAELEYSRRSMQRWWYELVQAEARGVSVQDLERIYSLYLCAVETYNHCVAACLSDHQEIDATEMASSQASCLPET